MDNSDLNKERIQSELNKLNAQIQKLESEAKIKAYKSDADLQKRLSDLNERRDSLNKELEGTGARLGQKVKDTFEDAKAKIEDIFE